MIDNEIDLKLEHRRSVCSLRMDGYRVPMQSFEMTPCMGYTLTLDIYSGVRLDVEYPKFVIFLKDPHQPIFPTAEFLLTLSVPVAGAFVTFRLEYESCQCGILILKRRQGRLTHRLRYLQEPQEYNWPVPSSHPIATFDEPISDRKEIQMAQPRRPQLNIPIHYPFPPRISPSFEIIEKGAAIKCLLCKMVSYHPTDKKRQWCGKCKISHSDRAQILFTVLDWVKRLEGIREMNAGGILNIKYYRDCASTYLKRVPYDREMREAIDILDAHIIRLEKRLKAHPVLIP